MPADNLILEPEAFYATSEPEKPTEEVEVTANEAEVTPEEPEESEKVEASKEEEAEADTEEEALFVEIDGEEVNLDDVKQWREGHMMQSDYTKKTMALADERKTFEAERESERKSISDAQTKVTEMSAMLEVLVSEDSQTDWDALWESDPDEWKIQKEKADKRVKALEDLQAKRVNDDPETIRSEQEKLVAANPDWLKDGKPTDVYKADAKLMNDYALTAGFTPDEFSSMTKAHYLLTILKAAKYDQLQEKGREIKAKREKVPVVTKPKKAAVKQKDRSAADVLYG